jgi:hypothetical protein
MHSRRKYIIGLTLIGCLAQAQEVSWVQTYEISPHATSAFDVIHLPGQGFVVCGSALFPPDSGDFQGWVMHTDLQGNVVWSQTYGSAHAETFESVALLNNQLWIAGHRDSAAGPDVYVWPLLCRISLTGDSLWSLTFPDWQLGHRFHRILATPEGNLCVTSDYPVLSELDTLGNILWSIRGPERHSGIRALAPLPEGGVVVACNTGPIPNYWTDTTAIRVYWVNEEGIVTDSADFTDYRWNHAECILPISQNEVIVGGFTQPGEVFYDEYPLVFRIDRAGQVDWQFVGNLEYIGRIVSGVQSVNDSIWAVSYNLHSELGARDPLLHVFDRNGNPQGLLPIDADPSGYSYDYAYATAFVEPAAIIITGASSISSSPWKAFLALVSSTSGTDKKWRGTQNLPVRAELNMTLSAETAIIELPELVQGEVSVVIYDILGRTVYQTRQLMSNTQLMSFPMRAPSGMYFVTATNAQHQWHGRAVLCR